LVAEFNKAPFRQFGTAGASQENGIDLESLSGTSGRRGWDREGVEAPYYFCVDGEKYAPKY
jgi:hypothetical protein